MGVSLKNRLMWILALLILLSWMGSALLTGGYSLRVVVAQIDRQLEQYLDLVGYITNLYNNQLEGGGDLAEPLRPEMFERGGENHLPIVVDSRPEDTLPPVLNIWMGDTLLAVLEGSPRFDPPREEGFGYRPGETGERQWRILARYDARTQLWLVVGVDVDAARWSMLRIFGQALLPLLLILPLTALLLYFGIDRGLLPMHRLAAQIQRRKPGLLDPVPRRAVPEEVAPVVDALNDLLERLAHALESEQRFTANAAHELMTPLAAIKTEVQLCQRQLAGDPAGDMLQRIVLRVDRATHTVQQLLTLARLEPGVPLPMTDVLLDGLLRELVTETGHLAAERDLQLDLSLDHGVSVQGNAEALAILLRNLLVNAFRYADEGSTVRIDLTGGGQDVRLRLYNDCPPLSAEAFARIGQAFYRQPGSRGAGAGLGLAIAAQVAQLHWARFSTGPGSDGQGFCAELRFPEAG